MPTMVIVLDTDVNFSVEAMLLYRQKHPILFVFLRNITAVVACYESNLINFLPIKRKDT